MEDDDSFAFFWNGHRTDIVKTRKKSNADQALALVLEAGVHLNEVDSLDTEYADDDCRAMSSEEKRAVRLFGKCRNATAIRISAMRQGLSGSRVLRVNVITAQGGVSEKAIAKIDVHAKIQRERINYDTHVNRLPAASCPAAVNEFFVGCGDKRGLFYQLAENANEDFFTTLATSDGDAVQVVQVLRNNLRVWHGAVEYRETTVGDMRREVCPEAKFEPIRELMAGIDFEAFELRSVNANWSTQHGDLHGENVLVPAITRPLVIDFADVRQLPSNYDAITLELSPYFHPSSRADFPANVALAQNWHDRTRYLESVPHTATATAIRNWIENDSFTARQRYAATYAYCVRQLTYPGINRDFALQLIRTSIERFSD